MVLLRNERSGPCRTLLNKSMKLLEAMRDLQYAQEIWQGMSPLARYKLIDELPYVSGKDARSNACIRHIADNLDQFR